MSGGIHTKDTGLVLYSARTSFYSQKARLALAWKGVQYEGVIVDMQTGVYEPWFLRINPKGKIPALVDGNTILTESGDIITHIDNKYKTVGPRLQPDPNTGEGQEVKHFTDLLASLAMPVITYGGVIFAGFTDECLLPRYVRWFMKRRARYIQSLSDVMRARAANASADLKDVYQTKATAIQELGDSFFDREALVTEVEKLEKVFTEIEASLRERNFKSSGTTTWLCADHQTEADILLAVTLQRLNVIGYRKRLWADNKRPLVAKYYANLLQDEHFRRECVDVFSSALRQILSTYLSKFTATFPYIFYISVICGVAGIGFWYFRQG